MRQTPLFSQNITFCGLVYEVWIVDYRAAEIITGWTGPDVSLQNGTFLLFSKQKATL